MFHRFSNCTKIAARLEYLPADYLSLLTPPRRFLRRSTQAPRPPSSSSCSSSSAASFLPAVTRASRSARVFVNVCMHPDVYLTAFHQTSHQYSRLAFPCPLIAQQLKFIFHYLVCSPLPSAALASLPLFPSQAVTLAEERIVFANHNLPYT